MTIPLRGSEQPAANPQIHKPPTVLNFSSTMSQSIQKFRKKKNPEYHHVVWSSDYKS